MRPQHAGLPELATSNSLTPTFPFCTYTAFASRPQPRLCISLLLYQSQSSHLAVSSAQVKMRQDAWGGRGARDKSLQNGSHDNTSRTCQRLSLCLLTGRIHFFQSRIARSLWQGHLQYGRDTKASPVAVMFRSPSVDFVPGKRGKERKPLLDSSRKTCCTASFRTSQTGRLTPCSLKTRIFIV